MTPEFEPFVEGLFEGFAILFLGSGFSAQATNEDNRNLPTGTALATLPRNKTGIVGDYPLDVISREFTQKFGEHKLFELLQTELIATEVSQAQCDIISLPWRRIYTTNYDNVVELAAGKIAKKIAHATLGESANPDRAITQCVHLNGRLKSVAFATFARDIKLTRASYLTDTFLNTGWLATFRNDLSLATSIVFVGYSMYDIDVARIVYEDPMLKAKTCFVDAADLDPIIARELRQYGEVFPGGINEFAQEAIAYSRRPVSPRRLTAFDRFSLPSEVRTPSGDDVTSLFLRGEIGDDLILGSHATRSNYVVDRAALGTLLTGVKSGDKRFVVHADLGNGKTVFLHTLRVALAQAGYNVLELKPTFDLADEDIRLIGTSGSADVVIVEELYRNKDTINKLCFAAPNATVITTSRTSLFDLRNSEVEDLLHGEFVEIDLNHLNEVERTKLIAISNENGLWGDLSSRSPSAKMNFVKENCGNEIRSFVLHLFSEPKLKERIKSTFYSGADTDTLKCLAVILLLDVANFEPDLFVVTQLTGIDLLRTSRLKKDPISREYVDVLSGKVRVKSSILGQFILKEIFDYDVTLGILIDAVHRCEAAASQNALMREVQKDFMKFSFVDKIFARTRRTDHYVRFYDSLKTLRSMARNPQFWLQYAIARLEHSDFRGAHTLFRTAHSHAASRELIITHFRSTIIMPVISF